MLPVQTAPAPRERPRSGPAASQSNPCNKASGLGGPSCTCGPCNVIQHTNYELCYTKSLFEPCICEYTHIHSHLPEWSPAVSADEALGVELVPHGGDHSVQTRLVTHTADGGGGPLVWAEKIFILWF